MQILMIAGNVGKDAKLREAAGDSVLNFSVAVDNGKDRDGNKRDATWYDCAIWGKRATSLERHILKGTKLALTGRPTVRVHEGKAYLGITISELTFMGSSGGNSDHGGGDRGHQAPADSAPDYAERRNPPPRNDMDDEIPF
jgi:single-strand DNA-binding protein